MLICKNVSNCNEIVKFAVIVVKINTKLQCYKIYQLQVFYAYSKTCRTVMLQHPYKAPVLIVTEGGGVVKFNSK